MKKFIEIKEKKIDFKLFNKEEEETKDEEVEKEEEDVKKEDLETKVVNKLLSSLMGKIKANKEEDEEIDTKTKEVAKNDKKEPKKTKKDTDKLTDEDNTDETKKKLKEMEENFNKMKDESLAADLEKAGVRKDAIPLLLPQMKSGEIKDIVQFLKDNIYLMDTSKVKEQTKKIKSEPVKSNSKMAKHLRTKGYIK